MLDAYHIESGTPGNLNRVIVDSFPVPSATGIGINF